MDKKLFFTLILVLLLIAIFYLIYLLFAPFIPSLLWAGMIVVMVYPWYHKLLIKVDYQENLAALLMCLLVTLFLLLPLLLLTILATKEVIEGSQTISKWLDSFELKSVLKWPSVISGIEFISRYVDIETVKFKEALINSIEHISEIGINLSTRFFLAFSNFFITLALVEFNLFFFFRDGKRFVAFLRSLLPIDESSKEILFFRMKEVTQTSVYGSVATAGANGLLGGIAFGFLGLPSPILWGALMGMLSFIPVTGAIVVWAPASMYLFFQGHPIKGTILIIWCVVLMMGVTDYMVRPFLIHKISSDDNQLNTLVLFLSVMGGLQLFGLLGIVLGPFIVVLALTLIDLWRAAGGLNINTGPLNQIRPSLKVHVNSPQEENSIDYR